ncbi:Putative phosphatidylinositol-glycan biosynthesis class S protein [Septoria linicola]|uniref:Phosphatidylinositol-glycan biosynthesis class S protein n=1 Tax=Septoria linicola TaxID=215465 RepID=A0A9Q9ALP9_9PEZI|nr:putative phosphatidylinositol-glycan biosynthesis class S protein [Septoria linicola]USW47111.1 Putative phosphatidylinositol-glycan biosynthesis class S protein [Septoria linicola]
MDAKTLPVKGEKSYSVPSESNGLMWTRRLVILAFWAVVVFLGLPHWTWTTSISRSSLPLDAMNAWADGKTCQLQYPLDIHLQAPSLPAEQTLALAGTIEAVLSAQDNLPLHSFRVLTSNALTPDHVLTVKLDSAITPRVSLRSWEPILDIKLDMSQSINVGEIGPFIAQEILRIFGDESAALGYLIRSTNFAHVTQLPTLDATKQQALDGRTTRAFKAASNYHITFSLFTPTASPSAWAIDAALQEYIEPLLHSLSSISNFTIDTQVQLYAAFSPSIAGPVYDEEKAAWTLNHADLTGFVNAAEWPLNPSIGAGPTINFVLYVPSPDRSPLLVEGDAGTSWIIPQWGGVQIHNSASTDRLELADLRPDMITFADQLVSLLGVPQSPPSLPLRTSSLERERATALILSASSTLGALARLTLKLTSIAIPESVAASVDDTLSRLNMACQDLRQGHFQSALANARVAESEVEHAFFFPSMVGQVYFPEEHKVAVYVPLLGPMAVPLIMAGMKELRSWLQNKRKTS